MDTTEDLSVHFNAVSDDTKLAVGANGRKRVNGALEAIEGVTFSINDHFKGLVIFVLANFARRHTQFGSREALSAAVSNFSDTEI